jgi:formamidopyrimidine-DNA glycosylase
VTDVEVIHADVLREPAAAVARKTRGRTVGEVGRRGKNVVVGFESGGVLLVNLGMTGRLLPRGPTDPPPPEAGHPAVRIRFGDGSVLVYDDTRRFGMVEVLGPGEWIARSAGLGPEPLDDTFTAARLGEGLARSRSPVRSWLLDQRRIAGVGNIYASESLHRARIHPLTPAREIDGKGVRRLHRGLRSVLRDAIEAGGTTLRDYRTAAGRPGTFASRLAVYGKEGEPCPRCSTPVDRIVFSNRSAFLCPRCQPEPGAAERTPDAPDGSPDRGSRPEGRG